MAVPVAIYLLINLGQPSARGWGTAMSTDTAFALGVLALVGTGIPDRVRTYLLTFALVDDVAGIVVIAVFFSDRIAVIPWPSASPCSPLWSWPGSAVSAMGPST